jgi:hypothetical protein
MRHEAPFAVAAVECRDPLAWLFRPLAAEMAISPDWLMHLDRARCSMNQVRHLKNVNAIVYSS